MARTMLRSVEKPPSATAPIAQSVVSLSSPTRRRPSWVLLGSLLVGLAALLGAWVFTATSERISIVVASHDVAPGEVVGVDDLRVVEMGKAGELRAIQSNQQNLIIGRVARGPIPEGTVLNTDLFVDRGQAIPAGMVVVGASLEAGAAPTSGLRAGDQVDVLGVQRTSGTPTLDGAPAPTAALLTTGTVWSVERTSANSSTSKLWIALLVPESSQGLIAQAAADGLLRLSLVASR